MFINFFRLEKNWHGNKKEIVGLFKNQIDFWALNSFLKLLNLHDTIYLIIFVCFQSICGGPERGKCVCNKCECVPGSKYQGTTCEDCKVSIYSTVVSLSLLHNHYLAPYKVIGFKVFCISWFIICMKFRIHENSLYLANTKILLWCLSVTVENRGV